VLIHSEDEGTSSRRNRREDGDISATATGSALPRVVAGIVFLVSRDQGVDPSLLYLVSTVLRLSVQGKNIPSRNY
jgi:hypothetical protein